jgi:hypothetical protein
MGSISQSVFFVWDSTSLVIFRVVDPDSFNTDPDPAFLLNPDPDPVPDPS